MTQTASADKKPTPKTPPASDDLSKAIEESVERKADEHARCVHLFDDYYRCNWWVPDKTPHPFWLSTGRIRTSKFLRVTRAASGLLIEDMGSRSVTRR